MEIFVGQPLQFTDLLVITKAHSKISYYILTCILDTGTIITNAHIVEVLLIRDHCQY